MSEFLGDNVCKTASSLMCDRLNVTMEIDLASSKMISYYVEDLVGDVDNKFAGVNTNMEKTQKLLEIIQKVDPDLHVDEETFGVYAEDVADMINSMLEFIVGVDPFLAQEGITTPHYAEARFFDEVPESLVQFNTKSGFLLPDGASYAYKNCSEFKNMFDAYYPYMQN